MNKVMVGFIGGGNMAEGIISGMLTRGDFEGKNIFVREILYERAEYLMNTYAIEVANSLAELAKYARLIVIAVHPQQVETVAVKLRDFVEDQHIIISICAGIKIAALKSTIGKNIRYARIMPNTMSSVGRGYSALAFSDGFSIDDKIEVQKITDAIGRTMFIDENKIDAFTASSCAGPEWIILFAQGLISAAVESGLSLAEAQAIVWENLEATGILLAKQEKHPAAIIEVMNTPGGIGIAGYHSFAKSGLTGIVMDGVMAAYQRTVSLGQK